MMEIDAHQHFWEYDPGKHSWINEQMSALKRDFLPSDLKQEMDKVGVKGCVAVQADQSEAETEFLLELAEKHDYIRGVVGWLDIRAENLRERLEHYVQYDALKGLRHIVQDEPDDRFLLKPDFLRGIEILGSFDLTYDILIYARHLPVAIEFASRFPDQKFVLDHIAKPEIGDQKIDEWAEGIREIAAHPKLHCKISGMVTEADWENWKKEDFKPYLEVVFDAFGPERLMFGSDWPVCTLAAEYEEVYGLLEAYMEPLAEEEKQMILGGNAQQFYNL